MFILQPKLKHFIQKLNLSYFISKRIRNKKINSFSGTIHSVAIASIGMGLAILIIAFLVLGGFKDTIRDKMVSFDGHIQITKLTLSSSFEEQPIAKNPGLLQLLKNMPETENTMYYAHKTGLLKANEEVEGVLLKGIDNQFDSSIFNTNMVKGRFIHLNDTSDTKEVVISQKLADKLLLQIGDRPLIYFIQEPIKVRRLTITGIYETGMEDFDERVIIGDLKLVQSVNDWPDSLVGGVTVHIENFKKLDYYYDDVNHAIPADMYPMKVTDKFREIFDWLELLNTNVAILITIILFVASFNMISILLIMIMERTSMIGLLKALGAEDFTIRKIFTYNGVMLVVKGMVVGNIIGIGLGLIQDRFRLIHLDPENYYMGYVPISWDITSILLVNLFTVLLVGMVLLLPTLIISRMNPVQSIRFD
jgi:lipoprotein-releasing system permease protein